MKTARLPATLARCLILALTLLLLGSAGASADQACWSMLKPLFYWADQDTHYFASPVDVTISTTKPQLGKMNFMTHGSAELRRNWGDTTTAFDGWVSYKGALEGRVWVDSHLGLLVKITEYGTVSVQMLSDGKPYLGRPAEEFTGTCGSGSIAGSSITGTTVYMMTLSKGAQWPKIY